MNPTATIDNAKANTNGERQIGVQVWCRFIEPGVVRYKEHGTILARLEFFQKIAPSFKGCPVFNLDHRPVGPADFSSGKADGIIEQVMWGPPPEKGLEHDGWFWASQMIWDADTLEACKRNEGVSCAYDVTDATEKGGLHNNVPYVWEALDGFYTHMAVVSNPRYEDAHIVYNSKGGDMKLKLWEKVKDATTGLFNSVEKEVENPVIDIDGDKNVPLANVIEAYKTEKAALANAEKSKAKEDEEVDVDGEKVPMKNLMDSYRRAKNAAKAKNDEGKEKGEAEKGEKEKDAGKDKEEKERGKEEGVITAKNAKDKFEELAAARNKGKEVEFPDWNSTADGIKAGRERYGRMPGQNAA